jgi:hypothetical protein
MGGYLGEQLDVPTDESVTLPDVATVRDRQLLTHDTEHVTRLERVPRREGAGRRPRFVGPWTLDRVALIGPLVPVLVFDGSVLSGDVVVHRTFAFYGLARGSLCPVSQFSVR